MEFERVDISDIGTLDYFDSDDARIIKASWKESQRLGDIAGRKKNGDKWDGMIDPAGSEQKLRIVSPPTLGRGTRVSGGKVLNLKVIEYPWCDLVKNRALQQELNPPVNEQAYQNLLTWAGYAVALTANALIHTADDALVFHQKKGGAAQGSIHTFGGYLSPQDLVAGKNLRFGGIEAALLREVGEKDEAGLKRNEVAVTRLFGTADGKPSVLWNFGTGAIYGVLDTVLSAAQLQERVRGLDAGESLSKNLYVVPVDNVRELINAPNIHPQTRQVLPSIIEMYK